jgi:glutamyl-tRNA reductase
VRLQGLTAEQQAAVETLTRGLANKFLHLPLQALRDAAQQGDAARLEVLRETFRLEACVEPEPMAEPAVPAAEPPMPTEDDPAIALPGGKKA